MSAEELAVRVLAQMEPLLPYMLAVTAATAAALVPLLLLSRGLWVDQPRFRWLGLFFGLSTGDCARLACAWSKLVLLLGYLAAFRKLDTANYLLFLAFGAVYAVSFHDLARIPGRILWLALELVALVSCNLLCGYIRDVNGAALLRTAYILMAIFMSLFGAYLFLIELNDISAGRHTELGYEWQKGPEDEEGEGR